MLGGPDALGWKGFGWSLLVECKASRADFRRDAKKPFRQYPAMGVGTARVYLTPPGLLTPADMPPLWGLAEVRGRSVRLIVKPQDHPEKNTHAELRMLLAHTRFLEGKVKPLRPAKPLEYQI